MGAKTTLPSNGFGRIEQEVVFSIPIGQEKNLPGDLEITLLEKTTTPPMVSYLWRRWSTRRGDDEDIVFELSSVLGTGDIDWQVDWARSTY